MKKMAVFGMLFLFMCFSGFAGNTRKKSRKIRHLIENVDLRLDSIVHTPVYETIQGHEYYRFSHGVLVITTNSNIITGEFIKEETIRFKSCHGEISFSDTSEKRRVYIKNLKRLSSVLSESW